MQWNELIDLPRYMASAISPLFESPSIVRYQCFLNTMYHYTKESKSELLLAARLAPDQQLQNLFYEFAKEEANHFKLAQYDLNKLGQNVSANEPYPVIVYRRFWKSISKTTFFQFMGAMFVFENAAQYLEASVLKLFQDIPAISTANRFIHTHLYADDIHGKQIYNACKNYFQQHADMMMSGAKIASQHWIDIHLEILK